MMEGFFLSENMNAKNKIAKSYEFGEVIEEKKY